MSDALSWPVSGEASWLRAILPRQAQLTVVHTCGAVPPNPQHVKVLAVHRGCIVDLTFSIARLLGLQYTSGSADYPWSICLPGGGGDFSPAQSLAQRLARTLHGSPTGLALQIL
jgi:hypothetical protein